MRETYNKTLENGTFASVPFVFQGIREPNLTLPFKVVSASEHYFYDRVLDITAGKYRSLNTTSMTESMNTTSIL